MFIFKTTQLHDFQLEPQYQYLDIVCLQEFPELAGILSQVGCFTSNTNLYNIFVILQNTNSFRWIWLEIVTVLHLFQGEIDQLESSVDPTTVVANRLTELVCECAEGPAKTPAPIFNALDNSVSSRTISKCLFPALSTAA